MRHSQVNKSSHKIRTVISLFIFCLIIITVISAFRKGYSVKNYSVQSPVCAGMKILQISDIHWSGTGDYSILLKKSASQLPDVIVLTGDTVDSESSDFQGLSDFLGSLSKIAPVYAVSGNHDRWDSYYETLSDIYTDCGIVFLEDSSAVFEYGGESVNFLGITDPPIWSGDYTSDALDNCAAKVPSTDGFDILLFHRADMAYLLTGKGYELILSGHLHGGIIIVPFIGGLASPGGEWFPEYTGGEYDFGLTKLIVSRGIAGYGNIPRINNPPELSLITLVK